MKGCLATIKQHDDTESFIGTLRFTVRDWGKKQTKKNANVLCKSVFSDEKLFPLRCLTSIVTTITSEFCFVLFR